MRGRFFGRVTVAVFGHSMPLVLEWAVVRRSLSVIFQCVKRGSLATLAMCLFSFSFVAADQDDSEAAEPSVAPETSEAIDYKKLKSPFPYTKKSIKRGRSMFIRVCAECHGPDAKSQIDVIADATDLTVPKLWRSGTTEGEVFRSIKEGAGESMPPFKMMLKREEDMWHMVNFIRSLWPPALRPQLQEEEAETGSSDEGKTS